MQQNFKIYISTRLSIHRKKKTRENNSICRITHVKQQCTSNTNKKGQVQHLTLANKGLSDPCQGPKEVNTKIYPENVSHKMIKDYNTAPEQLLDKKKERSTQFPDS